jgi:hypothetical protein
LVEQGQHSSIANYWTKIPEIFLRIYGISTVFKNCIYLFHDFSKKNLMEKHCTRDKTYIAREKPHDRRWHTIRNTKSKSHE